MKSKRSDKLNPHVTHGSVLDDLGFSPAEALAVKVKADIYRDLMIYIRKQAFTQQQLAAALAIPQPDVSNLVNGRVAKFSVGKLIKFAGRLNLGAEVKLTMATPTRSVRISASGTRVRKHTPALAS